MRGLTHQEGQKLLGRQTGPRGVIKTVHAFLASGGMPKPLD
ncbi:hypothetical protein [Streptomyces sp. WG7]